MTPNRNSMIRAGFDILSSSGLPRLLRPAFGGIGLIFMLHHVRPASSDAFQPNRHLEITPDFLRATLTHLRAQDIETVTMDEACRRLAGTAPQRRFACFTFDDGYRDNRDHALPVMREFGAPMTVYVASDFPQGAGELWWVALERIVAKADTIETTVSGAPLRLDTATTQAKQAAFASLHDALRSLPDDHDVREAVRKLAEPYGIDVAAISRELCLSWDELNAFARDPLVTIGAHTVSHCNLAHESMEQARQQMHLSRARIEARLGRPVRHFAYPYGDKDAATTREFALAQTLGFASAVTTRPGMLFAGHARHRTALPRISLNGNFQNPRFLPVLTSGLATAMWNRLRRIDVA